MAMTKQQKQDAVAEIVEMLQDSNTVYLTNASGLTVEKVNKLRGDFRQAGVRYKVFKNTLLKRALEQQEEDFSSLYEHLSGPTAVAFTNDPATPAKVIKKFLDDNKSELPAFKAAFVDGAYFGEGSLESLTSLKSKDELLGDILGLLLAPITNIASALGAQSSGLAGAIEAIAEKAEA